jgi:hypothetical protein
MLQLFHDEQILTQSSEGAVTLTTHRICYEYKDWGRSYNQSIMLEHITSCENYFSTYIILLVLAGIALIGGGMGGGSFFATGLLVAIALGALYLATRKNFIIIASPSTQMKIKVTGMKRGDVLEFINKVEHAKHKRVLSLNNRPNAII